MVAVVSIFMIAQKIERSERMIDMSEGMSMEERTGFASSTFVMIPTIPSATGIYGGGIFSYYSANEGNPDPFYQEQRS